MQHFLTFFQHAGSGEYLKIYLIQVKVFCLVLFKTAASKFWAFLALNLGCQTNPAIFSSVFDVIWRDFFRMQSCVKCFFSLKRNNMQKDMHMWTWTKPTRNMFGFIVYSLALYQGICAGQGQLSGIGLTGEHCRWFRAKSGSRPNWVFPCEWSWGI